MEVTSGMKPKRVKWTDRRIQELRNLASEKNMAGLAKHFGVTEGQVRHQLRKHGIRKPYTWERSEADLKAIARHAAEHSYRETAKAFGITEDAVGNAVKRYKRILSEHAKAISEGEILRLRGIALAYARKQGRIEVSEDFASYVTVCALEGRQNLIPRLWVDYWREVHGDSRSSDYPIRMALTSVGSQGNETDAILTAPSQCNHLFELADRICRDERERIIFLLHFQCGFQLVEIAGILGLTDGRVNQVLSILLERARKHV